MAAIHFRTQKHDRRNSCAPGEKLDTAECGPVAQGSCDPIQEGRVIRQFPSPEGTSFVRAEIRRMAIAAENRSGRPE